MAFKKITRSLYSGEIELIFSPNSRNRYLVNDKLNNCTVYPPGVTTILNKVLAKEAIGPWMMRMAIDWLRVNPSDFDGASKAHVRKSDKGKDVGSEVHEAIELTLSDSNQSVQLSPEAAKPFNAFMDWFVEAEPRVLGTEQIVYSRQYNFSGTFDALLEIDGEVILCDVKTTNASLDAPMGVYEKDFLQLGAYSLAYKEMGGSRPKDLMVINANKSGKLSTLRASELGLDVHSCEAAWLNVLNTYRFLEPLKKQLKDFSPQKELTL
jgi:hypothetical protein